MLNTRDWIMLYRCVVSKIEDEKKLLGIVLDGELKETVTAEIERLEQIKEKVSKMLN